MARILIIDDQADVRKTITLGLRPKGFEVVEAESPAAGLKAIAESEFDLAIVDIFLRDSNGADVIRMLRERVPNLPVIAISGAIACDFLFDYPDLANVACLQKPFRPSELIKAIHGLLGPLQAPTDGIALHPEVPLQKLRLHG
jgi:DNA-binding response OmpR family regulator